VPLKLPKARHRFVVHRTGLFTAQYVCTRCGLVDYLGRSLFALAGLDRCVPVVDKRCYDFVVGQRDRAREEAAIQRATVAKMRAELAGRARGDEVAASDVVPGVLLALTAAYSAPTPGTALKHTQRARLMLRGIPGLLKDRSDLEDALDALRLLNGTPGQVDHRSFSSVQDGLRRVHGSLTRKSTQEASA
jgi:hypothetical protein